MPFLLTIPPSVGYDNNPLSLYYCYKVEGFTKNLKQCIAKALCQTYHHDLDMLGNWSMKTNAPGDNIFVTISVRHPKLGDYFTASLTGKRISSSAADHALFFWALKLWWKGVAFIQHPRYANVGYRQEALIRDMKLQCCPAFSQDIQNHQPLEGSDSDLLKDKNGRNRRFTWRDAKWPWRWLLLAAMVDGFMVRKMREEDAGTWVCSGVEAARLVNTGSIRRQ
ncbi:unnamed protein product [Camellia sinensis]